MTVLDNMFIGSRTLIHLERQPVLNYHFICTLILFLLQSLDMAEIAWISGHVLYNSGKNIDKSEGKISKEKKDKNDNSEESNNDTLDTSA